VISNLYHHIYTWERIYPFTSMAAEVSQVPGSFL